MTITNHILAGSLIGMAFADNPILAVVLAIASHFVMDALPHFGYPGQKGYAEVLRHKLPFWVGTVTAITTLVVVITLVAYGMWFALCLGALSASPDLLGIYNYVRYEKHGRQAHGLLETVHVKFHRAIQRYERPWGIYVEVVVFILLTYILFVVL